MTGSPFVLRLILVNHYGLCYYNNRENTRPRFVTVQVGPRTCRADRMINRAKKIKYLNQFELHTLIAQQDMGLQRRGRFPAREKQALCEEDTDWPAVTH